MFPAFSFGQAGSIQGGIKDATSGDGLIGAYVIVDKTSYGTATDIDGKYVLSTIPPGE